MIQLIASDMDGTLLASHLSISEKNREAIEIAREKGIEFVIATGRAYSEAKPALDDAEITCPIITGNGAQAFDENGNELFTFAIDKAYAKMIIDILNRHGIYFEVMTNFGVVSNSQPQRLENYAALLAESLPHITFKMAVAMAATQLQLQHIIYVNNYQELLDNPDCQMLKFIAFSDQGPRKLQPARSDIEKVPEIIITSSFPTNIEINHVQAQKGNAVASFAKERQIPLEQVMTIGDNYNDVSMLAIAGVSFAMGNAEEGVKEVAKYEADTNFNDGVGKAILRAIEENL